jgi:hypothetical protein
MSHSLALWERARGLPINVEKHFSFKFEDGMIFALQQYFTGRMDATAEIKELATLLHVKPESLKREFDNHIRKARNGAEKSLAVAQ